MPNTELADIIAELIAEGFSAREAKAIAEKSISKREKSLASSPESGRKQDPYGKETVAQAKERWIEQERRDPAGVYSPGGGSLGGIFGDSSVVLPDYDARSAAENYRLSQQDMQAALQLETLRLLRETARERENAKRVAAPTFARTLGRKRRY